MSRKMIICSVCKRERLHKAFGKCNSCYTNAWTKTPNGKIKRREIARRFNLKHRTKVLAKKREYRNSKQGKATAKAYQKRTIEQRKEYQTKYNHTDRGKASRKRYFQTEKGKVAQAKSMKKWKATKKGRAVFNEVNKRYMQSEKGQQKRAFYHRKRRALKKNLIGSHTQEDEVMVLKSTNGICPRCKKKKPLTIDHTKPITKGGTDDVSNLQPLCNPCNAFKGNRFTRRY